MYPNGPEPTLIWSIAATSWDDVQGRSAFAKRVTSGARRPGGSELAHGTRRISECASFQPGESTRFGWRRREAASFRLYEPVFHQMTTNVTLEKRPEPIPITMMGTGSYAHVYSYVDPDYGTKFAIKRAKKDLDDRDLSRFRQEFAVLSKLKFPYVVEVYRYDDSRNEYRMEYCDTTLRDYIARNNNGMSFAARKRALRTCGGGGATRRVRRVC